MEITWLGQAGLLFEIQGKKILVDPYLSDSVAKSQPQNYRRVPIDERFLEIKPDVIVITHNHGDHLDKETLCHYLHANSAVLVLSPYSAWQELRQFGGLQNNYVLFNAGTTWTEEFMQFHAVKAEHSDAYAIGVIISDKEKHYYITGDTLYNENIFPSLPNLSFEGVFLPVNGKGNNLNFLDAKRFAEKIDAKHVIPLHIGMFDTLSAENWNLKNKVLPKLYEKIQFE